MLILEAAALGAFGAMVLLTFSAILADLMR